MKFLIVFVALFAVALAKPAEVEILRSDANVGVDGYNFAYGLSNGQSAQEEGRLENAGSEDESIVVKGTYTFVADDGQTYTVNYIADKNGFQPEGAHLPVA